LYHGHFEQGGRPLPSASAPVEVRAIVKHIVTAKELHADQASFVEPIMKIFGHDGEWYGAHLPSAQPDFDYVTGLESDPSCTQAESAGAASSLRLKDLKNTAEARPRVGTRVEGLNARDETYCFKIKSEAYFSTLDLGQ
ncbi:MAG: hypothetical protein NTX25_10535, partial [Proteobacteria bacterium]|nr:hypothetical protein [Pseudomonadota bacterium]